MFLFDGPGLALRRPVRVEEVLQRGHELLPAESRDVVGLVDDRDPNGVQFDHALLHQVVKAARAGWRITEVDVDYAPRTGRSKVTGTVRGTLRTIADMSRVLAG